MSSRSKRPVLAGVLAVVAALSLSACGNNEPGAAAHVGDGTVAASDVNRLTTGYCAAFADQFKSDGTVLPLRVVRGYVVGTLAVNEAAQQLAAHYGIDEPEGYAQAVKDLENQAAGLPEAHRDDVLEVENAGAYTSAVEKQVGGLLLEQEGNTSADDAAKSARGQDALDQWIGEHPTSLNPKYGVQLTNGSFTDVDTDTSFPLSPTAVSGAKTQPDQAYAATLPSSQRCG